MCLYFIFSYMLEEKYCGHKKVVTRFWWIHKLSASLNKKNVWNIDCLYTHACTSLAGGYKYNYNSNNKIICNIFSNCRQLTTRIQTWPSTQILHCILWAMGKLNFTVVLWYKFISSRCQNILISDKKIWLATNFPYSVWFKVLTAVVMKSTIFWDIMSCSPLKVN
jgi:hypothetical protein